MGSIEKIKRHHTFLTFNGFLNGNFFIMNRKNYMEYKYGIKLVIK